MGLLSRKAEVTIDRLNIEEVNAIGDKKEYMAGKC